MLRAVTPGQTEVFSRAHHVTFQKFMLLIMCCEKVFDGGGVPRGLGGVQVKMWKRWVGVCVCVGG